MIGAGQLNRRITIERASSVNNALNEPVQTWTCYATMWARRRDASDGERLSAGQVGAFLMTRFTIRSSSIARCIRATDRVVHDRATWEIKGIKESAEGPNQFLELTCAKDADL